LLGSENDAFHNANTISKPLNHMKLITIKESHVVTDLLVLKSKLESEGIRCYLKNEFTTQIMSHMATFTVELQVPASDVKRAMEIMKGD
jgi:hypothetical protein